MDNTLATVFNALMVQITSFMALLAPMQPAKLVQSTPIVMSCEVEGQCPVYDFLNSALMSSIVVTIWTEFVALAGAAYWGAIDGLISLAKDLDL